MWVYLDNKTVVVHSATSNSIDVCNICQIFDTNDERLLRIGASANE